MVMRLAREHRKHMLLVLITVCYSVKCEDLDLESMIIQSIYYSDYLPMKLIRK